ncbi:hypothetical protein [Alkalihalobacterium bogoriense]|uniref:hypothetical protein n=1 Tax=Alkalihalobacterium bogoriense TaxID=246272 RepID=UPI00047EF6FF|nr:hypothetical protein [Alkalihalobacterium bogoriense]
MFKDIYNSSEMIEEIMAVHGVDQKGAEEIYKSIIYGRELSNEILMNTGGFRKRIQSENPDDWYYSEEIKLRGDEIKHALDNFPNTQMCMGTGEKVKTMLIMLNESYKKAKAEMQNLFTYEEAVLICMTQNSYMNNLYISDKFQLISSVVDAIVYEAFIPEGVNLKTLIEKLERLSEFETFTVTMMAKEIICSKGFNKFDEKLKRVFKPIDVEVECQQ